MATELAAIGNSFDEIARIGKAFSASGYFSDARDAAQAIVKVMAGREMGFGPFASMTDIHVIQGKPVVGANLMAAAVKSHPSYNYRIKRMDDTGVVIAFFERNGQGWDAIGESSFTMAEAKLAKLAEKDNWKKYPRNMLFSRAISNGVRWFCPDVFSGAPVYTPDEMGADVDAAGSIIEAPVVREVAHPEPTAEEPSAPTPDPAPTAEDDVKPTRPYDAWTLVTMIKRGIEARHKDAFTIEVGKTDNYRRAVCGNLEQCFASSDDPAYHRHLVTYYLVGKESSKDLDDAEIMTLHKWLHATKDETSGAWNVDPLAMQEARQAASAAMVEAGQQALPL